MPITVSITGADELQRKLLGLPDKVERKVIRGAVVEGARIVRDDARERAPMYHGNVSAGHAAPGTLKKSIILKYIPEQSRAGRAVYYVGVRHGKKYQKMGKKGVNRDAFYWYFVEFGHYTRAASKASKQGAQGVRFIPPVGFMRKAFATKGIVAKDVILAAMWRGIQVQVQQAA